MPLSCNSKRDLTGIVEIRRLQDPVLQIRILLGHSGFKQVKAKFMANPRACNALGALFGIPRSGIGKQGEEVPHAPA
jgi:hypothetical protein